MACMTVNVTARVRNLGIAKALVRILGLLSRTPLLSQGKANSLACRAVRVCRLEYCVGDGKWKRMGSFSLEPMSAWTPEN